MAKLDTIGKRAAFAIDQRKVHKRIKKRDVYAEIDATYITVSNWRCGNTDPKGYHLQQMAFAGYDVMWILTGRKSDET